MPTPPPRRAAHRWVWAFARVAIRTFYRVERVGAPLPDGAVLLVANHPNTLIDPAVVQSTAGRPVRFLAKSTLFRRHPLSWLVRQSGAIPVYRRIDAVDTTRNAETFDAVTAALGDGQVICLFPEGISHDTGHLEPLRTGAARMAISGARAGHAVSIVPVGLNFEHQSAFRSRVTAVFGAPVDWTDLVPDTETDDAPAVQTLTERIGQDLRHLLIEADPRRVLPLVTRVDRLYASARGVPHSAKQRVLRRRLIAGGIETLRTRDPERLESLLARVHAYDAKLERFGLRDRDVDQRGRAIQVAWFTVRELLVAVLLVPLATAAVLMFAVPYWVTGRISRWAPDLASRATWKVIVGALAYGAWISTGTALVAARHGIVPALWGAGALIALAFVGLLALERELSVFRTVRAFLVLRLTPLRARVELRRQRDDLATVMEQVGEWVRDVERDE